MAKLSEEKTPFLQALKKYERESPAPFDVPGHHMGNIKNPATELLGHHLYKLDVNAPLGLDNLAHPSGVLFEMESLIAETCHADWAFPLINGTSSGILAMFLVALQAGDKVILPRNVHKSVINALILSGAIPIYVMPEIDGDLEIAHQPILENWKRTIARNPSAKAIFLINPTYFGAIGDLKEITDFAHAHNMSVLVDEAHGAHYYFYLNKQPLTAMEAGADLSSVSFHKTAGSLTQSSVLLMKEERYRREEVQTALNILNTTSPSSLLLASLDGARAYMDSEEGKKQLVEVYSLANYAREEIKKIPGFIVKDCDYFLKHGAIAYDELKLVIGLDSLDIDGFEVYRLLRNKYHVQMELAETYAVLGILSLGTKKEHIDKLVTALKEISLKHYKKHVVYPYHPFDSSFPFMLVRPRVAFQAPGKLLPLEELDGEISHEQVMMYPPGIPLIVPGEVWTRELIERVIHYQKTGVTLHSSYKDKFQVIDRNKWKRYSVYEKRLKDYRNSRKTLPTMDGYRLPFEGEKHQRTLILMPYRPDTWRQKAEPAKKAFYEVIKAIAKYEEVEVGIHPAIYKQVAPLFNYLENVRTFSVRYNDAWARDNMPLFVSNGQQIRAVDFRFNAWGGAYNGLYRNYRDDDRLSSLIAKRFKLMSYVHPSFVLEGGSIIVDGEGTLITTEACLLSKGRNPTLRREEIVEILQEYLGVQKVIWVPHGIYNDETDEHIDNMVAFVKPGEVVMAWTDNQDDPQYAYCQATYLSLKKAKDAKGRHLKIHKLPLPATPLYMSEETARELSKMPSTLDERKGGRRLAASYINFYQGEKFVIAPKFNVKEDSVVYRKLKLLFPTKEIIQIDAREILLGGGGIHCITMQYPAKEEENA